MFDKLVQMKEETGRRFVVSGRVQGVGYRAFAQQAARKLGVTGWARNLSNGDVEVQANGTPHQLDNLESLLRQGPPWSEVRSLSATETPVSTDSTFHIR